MARPQFELLSWHLSLYYFLLYCRHKTAPMHLGLVVSRTVVHYSWMVGRPSKADTKHQALVLPHLAASSQLRVTSSEKGRNTQMSTQCVRSGTVNPDLNTRQTLFISLRLFLSDQWADLLVKRKSSSVLANSGHMLSNFPEEACCRATGSPMERTLRREATASFHVLSEGQAYFKLRGTLRVWGEGQLRSVKTHTAAFKTKHHQSCKKTAWQRSPLKSRLGRLILRQRPQSLLPRLFIFFGIGN